MPGVTYHVPNICNNLMAVSELCDVGCEVTFDNHSVMVHYSGFIVLQGW